MDEEAIILANKTIMPNYQIISSLIMDFFFNNYRMGQKHRHTVVQ